MLTDDRRVQIAKIVEDKGSASVQELMNLLDASESTIRRDLTELDKKGLLHKVHGGALSIVTNSISTSDATFAERANLNFENKLAIAKYAASLIDDNDIVFLDSGTTTILMGEYIESKKAIFVTNGLEQAKRFAALGLTIYMTGGYLKTDTESLVGADACHYLQKMNFTKGFLGTNGITEKNGFTTPDTQEASVKAMSFLHCKDKYVLADSSKFDAISAVTFAEFTDGKIITDSNLPDHYKNKENIIIV